MKYVLVIPDGTGIRNFLCTSFLEQLLKRPKGSEVVIWHALPEASLAPHRERWAKEAVRWVQLPALKQGRAERVLRKAGTYAQLYWQRPPGTDVALEKLRPSGSPKQQLVSHAARFVGRAAAGARRISALDHLHWQAAGRAAHLPAFRHFLREERPGAVFCTHQRAPRAVPAMLAAQQESIPAATFIYSWDNIPKNRTVVPADVHFVWSEHMRREVLRYYPYVREQQVRVVGTPQFEHYFSEDLLQSREAFMETLGADAERPIVCFSGDDVTTSPHDEQFLKDVAEASRDFPEAGRPQILFRRCPTETNTKRYARVLRQYPEIVVSEPAWAMHEEKSWSAAVPKRQDVALLANIVRHCAAVINLGSTMAMDFAVLGKPGIYVNYEPVPAPERSARDIYRLPHFESVHELQPVHWAHSRGELREKLRLALQGGSSDGKAEARQAWLDRIVAQPLSKASRRCAEALCEVADRKWPAHDGPSGREPDQPASRDWQPEAAAS